MFRTPFTKRRNHPRTFLSSLALSLALAGATAVGLTAVATPAYAAKKKKEEEETSTRPKYEKAFVDAYKPVEDIFKAAKDAAGAEPARPLIQPLLDTITNDDERFAAGGMLVQLGLKLDDKLLQRQGLILQLDSGKVEENRKAQFNYFVGGISWQNKEYELAKKYFTKAFDLGYTGDDIESLLAATYFEQNQNDAGLAEIKRMEQVREAAGSQLPEQTLRSGLQVVFDNMMTDQIADWAALVVRHYPKPDTWDVASSVVLDSYELSPDEALDLYRLMKLNNALKSGRQYVDYINAADVRRMSNEVLPLLQEAVSKGFLKADDAFVRDNIQTAQARAPQDRADAEDIANDGRNGKDGIAARAAGDNYLSLGMPAKAAEMYALALQKGGVEVDRVQMRLAVAQAEAGDYDAARQSFAKVTGKRVPVVKMWLAYIDDKQSPPPAADAAPAADDTAAAADATTS